MNRCKHCGKEIDDKHKFCNSSCAAKFNNARRERKPWTEEQHLKNKRRVEKERHCKYCEQVISRGNCCEDCRPYSQYAQLLNRLGIYGDNLKDRYKAYSDLVLQMYFQEHKSIPEIGKELGLWRRQIEWVFNKAGVKARSRSESYQNGLETGRVKLSLGPKNRYESGFHVTWEGVKVWLRSSCESEYARQLDSQQIRYEVESKRIRYYDSTQQKERIAVPDFYLPDTNELVEVKSRYTLREQEMKDKFKAYRDLGYVPRLWLEKSYMAL
mgnify:CR=1 FL=1